MFLDEIIITVKGGDGGNGMVAFRREKYVDLGGPAGGNGGHGGNIIFQVDEGLSTLLDLRQNKVFSAPYGENGMSKSKHGANAEHYIVAVPPGTAVYEILEDGNEVLLTDMVENLQQSIIATGGRGGFGNIHFSTHKNPAPSISELGEPGEIKKIRLELKMLADCGLVGFPSVGKSTFLAAVSNAKPKVASYHFTTLAPNLGVVQVNDDEHFVLADLPGLIEGASEGQGLGIQFLRHIERTKVIAHVVDIGGGEGRDPYNDYLLIKNELENYNPEINERPKVIIANKIDEFNAEENLETFINQVKDDNVSVFPVSAELSIGVDEVIQNIGKIVREISSSPMKIEKESYHLYKYNESKEGDFHIAKSPDGDYILSGSTVERLYKMTNFDQYEATVRFGNILRKMGVDAALKKMGAKHGDQIMLYDMVFNYDEGSSDRFIEDEKTLDYLDQR